MTEQTKAQRLADLLETNIWDGKCGQKERDEAAAELRRLDAMNVELVDVLNLAWTNHGLMLMSDPPKEAWKVNRVDERIRDVLAKAKEQT